MVQAKEELNQLSDYVPGKSIEEICEQYKITSAVKLASNENALGASPKAKEVFRQMADFLHLYPRGNAPHLISALANKFQTKKENIIIGNGSDEIIDMIGKAFIEKGDECLGIRATFSVYKFTTLSNGGVFKSVHSGETRPELSLYLNAITEKTKVIFICNPNNPTGFYYTEQELLDFISEVPKHILVFIDEAYAEYAEAKDYPQLAKYLEKVENVLLNRTFSKIYGLAGLRLGYAFSSESVIKALWKIKPPFDVNLVVQTAAIAALNDKEHVEKTLKMNKSGKSFLTKELKNLGFEVLPSEANFIAVHIGENAKALLPFLESHGLIVRHLASFSLPEWIRVTIGKQEENELFISLLKAWKSNV